MNISDDICSLENSQRLKELGVKQESYFNWVEAAWTYEINTSLEKRVTEVRTRLVFGDTKMITDVRQQWAAFSSGALFDMLPSFVDTKKDEPFNFFYLHLVKRSALNIQYIANYYCDTHKVDQEGDPFFANSLIQERVYDEKLADCLAKMLINIIEKGYVQFQTTFVPENAASLILGK